MSEEEYEPPFSSSEEEEPLLNVIPAPKSDESSDLSETNNTPKKIRKRKSPHSVMIANSMKSPAKKKKTSNLFDHDIALIEENDMSDYSPEEKNRNLMQAKSQILDLRKEALTSVKDYISSDMKDPDIKELLKASELLLFLWTESLDENIFSEREIYINILENMEVKTSIDNMDAPEFEKEVNDKLSHVKFTNYLAFKANLIRTISDDSDSLNNIESTLQMVYNLQYSYTNKLYYHFRSIMLRAGRDTSISNRLDGTGMLRFATPQQIFQSESDKDKSLYVKYIIKTLYMLQEKGYRKHLDDVYEPRYTDSFPRYFTNSWKRINKIEKILYELLNTMDTNFDYFKTALNGNRYIKQAAILLENFNPTYFPNLEKSDEYYSFKNGVYHIVSDTFYPYDPSLPVSTAGGKIEPHQVLPKELVTSNYIDKEFTHRSHMKTSEIPTESLNSIMDDQNIPKDAQSVIYGLLGRGLFPKKEDAVIFDNYHLAPVFIGFAGCGKSSIYKALSYILFPKDYSIMSNTIQDKWAFSSMFDGDQCKTAIFGLDIQKNFSMDVGDLLSAIGHDNVLIQVKGETAHYSNFSGHMFFAANSLPRLWTYNGGAFKRRLVIVKFSKFIPKNKIDVNLESKILEQSGDNIQRMCREYIDMIRDHDGQDFWSWCPKIFLEYSDNVLSQSEPLMEFIHDKSQILIDDTTKDNQIKLNDFRESFKLWCEKQSKKFSWDKVTYEPIFSQWDNMKIVSLNEDKNGKKITNLYIKGLELLDQES